MTWDSPTDLIASSKDLIFTALERIRRTQQRVSDTQRRVIPPVCGGSGGNGSGDSSRHLRSLIATLPKGSPTIYAGPSDGHAHCDVCGNPIERGVVEYEADFDGLVLVLDRTCFALWQSEIATS